MDKLHIDTFCIDEFHADIFDIRNFTKEEYQKWYALMSPEKKERVDRYRHMEDKMRTVAGEMLARQMISRSCQTDEKKINILLNSYGKPYAQGLPVHFNISHSGDMVVCVVDDNPVGIDIEKIRKVETFVIERVCTRRELEYVYGTDDFESNHNALSEQKVYERFFEVWTTKEAYFKCIGTGITELKSVDIFGDVEKKLSVRNVEYVMSVLSFKKHIFYFV